jgi:hypothetical protein
LDEVEKAGRCCSIESNHIANRKSGKNVLATALSRKGVGSTGKPLALCITYS